MKRNSNCAPDLATLDLNDTNALSRVIRLKPNASVPKNQRDRIVLALKAYTNRAKLTNKYIALVKEHEEFGDDADTDTSGMMPQDIRERIADIITDAIKTNSNTVSKPKSTITPSKSHNKVSPSPSKKSNKAGVREFPNAKKKLVKTNTTR